MPDIRVLLVEDETIVRMDIKQRLVRLGYEVAGETDRGEEAVRLAAELRPDLVLMDVMLAGDMDGIQAAARIQAECDLPVIYLTAYADDETLHRARATFPFGFILKPFEDRDMLSALEMALYRHRVERQNREERKWREATLDNVGEGIVSVDREGRITYCNGAAARIAGRGSTDLRGMLLGHVFRFEDGAGQLLRLPDNGKSCPHLRSDKLVLDAQGGRKVPVELSCAAVDDDRDGFMGLVVAFRDITERRARLSELQNTVARLRQTVEATVQALVTATEKRDPYTAGHQQRVSALALAMGRGLGLGADRLEGLGVAALVHDLGKIQVPAEILAKPARLTDMEFGLVRAHSDAGYDILRPVPFPWAVAEFVRQHHERLDGTGYPLGLSGEDILLEARIIAVADVVEAMSSHRPYRAALGVERALEEVRAGRGTRYDPVVIDACLELFKGGAFRFE
ncbi:HD domain-containing phosphohydrolase [Desulfocurvus sp. DL9XJH121]